MSTTQPAPMSAMVASGRPGVGCGMAGTAVVAIDTAIAVATTDGITSWDAVIVVTGSVITTWLTVTLAGTDVWLTVTFAEELGVFTTMA